MADVLIEGLTTQEFNNIGVRWGPYWTTPLIGYVFFVSSLLDLKYRKTSDGGANWAAAETIRTGSVYSVDCWADWQTPGDNGTRIHLVYIDQATDDMRYVYLETATDTLTGDTQVEVLTNLKDTVWRSYTWCTITKTRGGNLAIAYKWYDAVDYFTGFEISGDAGSSWVAKADWTGAVGDTPPVAKTWLMLFPANLADADDLWAMAVTDDGAIIIETYDDSGNSWTGTIAMAVYDFSMDYIGANGEIRHSDGHLIFAAWNDYDNAAADLEVYDVTNEGSIAQKTNVVSNLNESGLSAVFIDQNTDDVYVCYAKGGTWNATVTTYYQKSVDGGANWGGETAMQANAADDERGISSGAFNKALGGMFLPVWYNDDNGDLYCNTDNGISFDAPLSAAVSSGIASQLIAGRLI